MEFTGALVLTNDPEDEPALPVEFTGALVLTNDPEDEPALPVEFTGALVLTNGDPELRRWCHWWDSTTHGGVGVDQGSRGCAGYRASSPGRWC